MDTHELRKEIDVLIYKVEKQQKNEMLNNDMGRAFSIVRTKLQEAKMWCGKVLESQNSKLPEEFRDETPERAKDSN